MITRKVNVTVPIHTLATLHKYMYADAENDHFTAHTKIIRDALDMIMDVFDKEGFEPFQDDYEALIYLHSKDIQINLTNRDIKVMNQIVAERNRAVSHNGTKEHVDPTVENKCRN